MPVRKQDAAPRDPPRSEPTTLPALETITGFLCARPPYLAGEPFEVPHDLFEAGRIEMMNLMKARGFPLPTDQNSPFENFVLFGKVIVQGERQ